MADLRTRGHPAALETVTGYLRGRPPHAILLAGPVSVGKTTLALDLAAGLLCSATDPADRPCGVCRSCRRVRTRSHPDLHSLAPTEPGRQIVIGRDDDPRRGIRHLIAELALAPLEGRYRVAVLEGADRMNEEAQNAFLKTLEEPPPASVIVLCADSPDRLLPTIRSRCATVRLGLVGSRTIEALLVERDLAEPPLAARLARIAAGRPGLAVLYALAPEAVAARAEVARILLDLLRVDAGGRLAALPGLTATAVEASAAITSQGGPGRQRAPDHEESGAAADKRVDAGPHGAGLKADAVDPTAADDAEPVRGGRLPASLRRQAARWLLETWCDVARDLLLVGAGQARLVRDVGLLDELAATAGSVGRADLVRFIEQTLAAEAAIEANASPELVLDVLVLAWPRSAVAA